MSCKYCGRKGRGYQREPEGYLQWHAWAEKKSKTHKQLKCPDCGRYTIWVKKG